MALSKIGTLGIADDAITTDLVANNAITTSMIASGEVGVTDLGAGVVTDAKVSASAAIASSKLNLATIAGNVNLSTGGLAVGGTTVIDSSRRVQVEKIGTGDAGVVFNSHGSGNLDALLPYDFGNDALYTSGHVDLGGSSHKFKDLHMAGAASVGSVKIGSTVLVDASRRVYPSNIQNSSPISFLDGSNGTSGSGAQGINVRHVYAGTGYASATAGAGVIEAANGFKVAGTEVINSSRDFVNVTSVTGGRHLITGSSTLFGSSSVQGFLQDYLVDTGAGYSRLYSYHSGGSNFQFLVNAAGTTTSNIALSINSAGNVLIKDGSNASPSLAFMADTDTGLIRVTTNALGLVAAGSRKFYVNATNAYFQNLNRMQMDGGTFLVSSDTEHQIEILSTSAAGASMRAKTAGAYAYYVAENSSRNWRFGAYGGSQFVIRDNTNTRNDLTLPGDGRVVTAGNLEVGGDVTVEKATTVNSTIRATGNNTRALGFYQAHTSAGADINMALGVFGDAVRGEVSTTTSHPLRLYVNNEPSKYLEISTAGTVFTSHGMVVNEDSHNSDFRVESNGNTHALFVDGGNDHVNIGGSTDQGGILNIMSASDTILAIGTSNSTADGRINFRNSAGNDQGRIWYLTNQNKFQFYTNGYERLAILNNGGTEQYAHVDEARWFTASSGFSNPTISLFTASTTGASYPQTCFEVTMYGNGVSANRHQVFRGGGTFDYSSTSSGTAQNLTTYTNYHTGNALPQAPSFALNGNTLEITCYRQTNYDFYRVEVRVWGRSFSNTWGTHS